MTDYFLRFINAATADAALSIPLPGYTPTSEAGAGWAVEHIGTIYEPATMGADGNAVQGAARPGYHVNVRVVDSLASACDATFAAFAVTPANPVRVWA